MTQRVRVRLVDGGSEVFDADTWACEGDGALTLFVTPRDSKSSLDIVATFAPAQWGFVSKLVSQEREWIVDLCNRARAEQADDSGLSDSRVRVDVAELMRAYAEAHRGATI